MLESTYQSKLIRKLHKDFPEAIVLKNDSSYLQGIPDLTVFNGSRWAWLEVKADEYSERQPNQEYYIDFAVRSAFGAFIYPTNENEVLRALSFYFR
jgi:hypothetical protein